MNIYLIGSRGAGKSAVARQLAELLDRECFAVDQQIQDEQQQTIAEIFSRHGEARFRALESEKIGQAARASGLIVDLGGGAVLDRGNRQWIRESGKCIWLKAQPEVLWARIQADEVSDESRPPLSDLAGIDEVKHILAQRQAIYDECAEYAIETDGLSPREVAQKIVSWLATVDNK